jgi:hypothetical protein
MSLHFHDNYHYSHESSKSTASLCKAFLQPLLQSKVLQYHHRSPSPFPPTSNIFFVFYPPTSPYLRMLCEPKGTVSAAENSSHAKIRCPNVICPISFDFWPPKVLFCCLRMETTMETSLWICLTEIQFEKVKHIFVTSASSCTT